MKKKLINGIIGMALIVSLGVNVVQANNNQFQQKVINDLESSIFSLENPSDANCELLETMWQEEEEVNPNIGTAYMVAIGDAYSVENNDIREKIPFKNQIVSTVIMAQDGAKEMVINTIDYSKRILATIGGNN